MEIQATLKHGRVLVAEAAERARSYAHAHRDAAGDAFERIAERLEEFAARLQENEASVQEITEDVALQMKRDPYTTKKVTEEEWRVFGPGEHWMATFPNEQRAGEYAEQLNKKAHGE